MALDQFLPGLYPQGMWEHLTAQGTAQEQQAQLANAAQNAMLHGNSLAQQAQAPAAAPPTERQKLVELSSRAREQFVSRMGGVRSKFFVPDTDCVYTHVVDDRVILFYCFSGKEGVASEPIDVFPSDQLIAQFRMVVA